MSGANFGDPAAVAATASAGLHQVFVGGRPCGDVQWLSDGSLRCAPPGQFIVGRYPVTVIVDGVNSSFGAWREGVVDMACPAKFYGRVAEWCLPCPGGARCLGLGTDPVALVCLGAIRSLGSSWMVIIQLPVLVCL